MKLYGLIGYPLSHSFSKKYFTEKFKNEGIKNAEYRNFEISSIDSLPDLIKSNPDLLGFSVTIPHKESIIPFLDNLDVTAKEIGAVNAVKISRTFAGVALIGYNTDCYGFTKSLQKFLKGNESSALIFGSGGASKAVQYALNTLNINYKIVSRNPEQNINNMISYADVSADMISQIDILVDTTPVGMWPKINQALDIPYQHIKTGCIAYDLTYNPEKTLFLQKAEKYGAIVCNGLKMLELQAERAWSIFTER